MMKQKSSQIVHIMAAFCSSGETSMLTGYAEKLKATILGVNGWLYVDQREH